MTAPDRPASSGRRRGRALVAVALVTAGVLAPVSAPLLPGSPTHGSDAAVQAQTSVVPGMLDDCPTDRPGLVKVGPEDRKCVYATEACPRGPVTKEIMTPSVDDMEHPDIINELRSVGDDPNKPVPLYRYPHFCEERMILAPVEGAAYDQAVFHIQPDEGQPARMILLPVVAAGSNPCITETEIVAMPHRIALETNADGDPLLDADGNLVLNASGMFGLTADGDPATVNMCRLLAQPQCADGLYRSDSNECRWVTRRTWQCPTGTLPRNEFRTCYQPPMPSTTAHPACGPGAPDMAALDCEIYVDNDYSRNPASLDCATGFDTGPPGTALSANTIGGSAAPYWCEFDASHLKVDCHSNPPASDCAPTVAHCLKRASRTGGCNAVAATIRCRAEHAGALTAEQVQGSDCQPCVVLPFSPPGPDCPPEYHSDLDRPQRRGSFYSTLHRVKQSIAVADYDCRHVRAGGDLADHPRCEAEPVCDAAAGAVPEGWLTWTSGHSSGLAIVNAPVVLTIEGLPGERLNRAHSKYLARGRGYEQPGDLSLSTTSYRAFDSDDVSDDPIIRIWPRMYSSATYNSVSDYTRSEGPACLLEADPDFMVTIEELWPDEKNDREEIKRLFGPSSLDRWDNELSRADRRSLTEQRGLTFWRDLKSKADKDQEREHRDNELVEKVPCNFGEAVVWCRWEPARAGYFTATGGGAWLLSRLSTPRSWAFYEEGNSFLTIAYGNILQSLNNYLAKYPDHFMNLLMEVNSELDPDNAIKLSDLGLKMSGSKPQTDTDGTDNVVFEELPNGKFAFKDNEWLYTEEVPVSLTCPSLDLRYLGCGETTTVGHYTTTEPIGIQIHEIRVTARTPNL